MPKENKIRKKPEKKNKISGLKVRRIFFHIILGTVIMLLFFTDPNFTRRLLIWVIILGFLLTLISIKFKIPGIFYMLKRFENPRYLRKFPGKSALFFIAGCLLVTKLFSPGVALASMAILTFGDPCSYIFSVFHKDRYKQPRNIFKNVYGTAIGILVGGITASLFVNWLYAFIAATIAMIAESFIVNIGGDTIDDNFFVPLIAGTVLFILFRINLLSMIGL
jgi:dolichol kinase